MAISGTQREWCFICSRRQTNLSASSTPPADTGSLGSVRKAAKASAFVPPGEGWIPAPLPPPASPSRNSLLPLTPEKIRAISKGLSPELCTAQFTGVSICAPCGLSFSQALDCADLVRSCKGVARQEFSSSAALFGCYSASLGEKNPTKIGSAYRLFADLPAAARTAASDPKADISFQAPDLVAGWPKDACTTRGNGTGAIRETGLRCSHAVADRVGMRDAAPGGMKLSGQAASATG
jgi:hypothetical protein